jgi:hypothetical protein
MGNQLKMNQKPFAIDAQSPFTTDQIWNQPAFRYTVNDFKSLTEAEAANLVATGGASRFGSQHDYIFNPNANGFALLDVSLHWVTERGPNLEMVPGISSARKTRMLAVIELDRSFFDPNAEIIGGEYLDDPSIGADRLRVAPFAWIAVDMGPDSAHNPFVRGDQVKELLELATADGQSGSCRQSDGNVNQCNSRPGCAYYLCSGECQPEGTAAFDVCPDVCPEFDGAIDACDDAGCAYYLCSNTCHPPGTSLEEAGCKP